LIDMTKLAVAGLRGHGKKDSRMQDFAHIAAGEQQKKTLYDREKIEGTKKWSRKSGFLQGLLGGSSAKKGWKRKSGKGGGRAGRRPWVQHKRGGGSEREEPPAKQRRQ